MAFEEFRTKNIKNSQLKNPCVAILKSGTISFNTACYEKYFKDVLRIIFFYDRERKIIGIKPAQKKLANSYILRKDRATPSGGQVSARSFLKSFVEIDYEKQGTKHYEVVWNFEENLLEVYLEKGG